MSTSYDEIIRRHCRPTRPQPTGVRPRLAALAGIRAVLWDVYGTMVTSASGDIGAAQQQATAEAFAAAVAASGVPSTLDPAEGVERLMQRIAAHHERSRGHGIAYPEVDIVDVWAEVMGSPEAAGSPREGAACTASDADLHRLALEYEVRTNPVWPMPGLVEVLERLRSAGMVLGIVSNAQFFTPRIFPALLGASLAEMGFDADLQIFSYRTGQAKPGTYLFERARDALGGWNLSPEQVLYVGNDQLNDVAPARQVGFRSALFAGDARSFRPRTGEGYLDGVEPDLVVTDLGQLPPTLLRRA